MKTNKFADPVAFFTNGVGDHFLNLPTLRALGEIFEGRLTLVCSDGECKSLFSDIRLRRMIPTEFRFENSTREFLVSQVRNDIKSCDLFVSIVPWSSHSLTALLGELAGTMTLGFSPAFEVSLPLDFARHSADLAFDAVRFFDPHRNWYSFAQCPVYSKEANACAHELRKLLPSRAKLLVLHADTSPHKMWSTTGFCYIVEQLLNRYSELWVFVVGWRDLGIAERIGIDRCVSCLKLQLLQTFSIIARADFFLGVDSCFLHSADFARIPSVGLFGPTSSEEFGFRLCGNVTIQAEGKMDLITKSDVWDAVDAVISDPTQKAIRGTTRSDDLVESEGGVSPLERKSTEAP